MPISRFIAHDSKIYGIDWCRQSQDQLTTCSLDKTVKIWDVKADPGTIRPLKTFVTDYPVWRARNLPFGRGFLAQPQRGRHKLDMYSVDQPDYPVHTFEGLTGVPKEYTWRIRGGNNLDNGTRLSSTNESSNAFSDDREFQLITWDKDAVLRFWPIDTSIPQVGIFAHRTV
jgi:WD40 repeat protein